MRTATRIILLLGVLLITSEAFATHIVGGSIHYTCIGNDSFDITLTVYTDCRLGQADYDKFAAIGVFNDDGQYIKTVYIPFSNKIDTLEQSDPCFQSIPEICYRVSQYRMKIYLPDVGTGYYLTYQRCCRNATIVNILDPLNTGASYWTYIPHTTLLACNSAPAFKNDPPIFICVDQLFVFDHSAIDQNKEDSLSYELIAPYVGGISLSNPKPDPPAGPPYNPVIWSPGHDLSKVMGDSPTPLSIDPVTGVLTVMPKVIGQFVVGVKVKEYRNGILIGENFRDFQFNVVPCLITQAGIAVEDSLLCDEFFVQFENTSTNAGTDFFWDFGDPNTGATSTEVNPSYTYSDTGHYTVMLIARKGAFCIDTAYQTIFIQRNSLNMCADISIPFCEDPIVLQLDNCTTDSISDLIRFDWTISTPQQTIGLTGPNHQVLFNEPTKATIKLVVETLVGCQDSITQEIPLNIIDPPPLVPDTVNLCYLESTNLNPNFDPLLVHLWTPDTFLLDPVSNPNPNILANASTTYKVIYTDSVGLCTVEREVLLTVIDDLPKVNLLPAIPKCIDSATLLVTLDTFPPDLTIVWEVNTGSEVFVGGGNSISITIDTSALVIVCATIMADNCDFTICDTIQVNVIEWFDLADTIKICEGDIVGLNPNGPLELIYNWSPPDWLDDPVKANPLANPPASILYFVTYTDTIGLCINNDSVFVQVNDSTKYLDFKWDEKCDGLTVDFINQSINVNNFKWDFGDPNTTNDQSTETNPSYTYPEPGTYHVMLTSPTGDVCPARDTIIKILELKEAVNEADFTWEYIQCGFPTIIQFYGMASSTYGVPTSWFWTFGSLGNSTLQNPTLHINEPTSIEVTLIVVWDELCSDTITKILDIDFIETNLPESVTICVDSCYQFGLVYDPNWVFTWSPPTWVDDVNSSNPLVCPDSSGLLTVEIQIPLANGDICILYDTIQFIIDACEWPCGDLPDEFLSCLDEVMIQIDECDSVFTFVWCNPSGQEIGTGPKITVSMDEYEFVVLKKIGLFGFIEYDTIYLVKLEYTVPVTAIATPVEIFVGDTSQLLATNTTGTIFSWSPTETLNDPSIPNPLANPTVTTIYTVFVTDPFGCTGSDTTMVIVYNPNCDFPNIYVPNTFTPNNDNLNDKLYVRGNYIDEMEFYIYNRWGELVFETKDKNVGWDGTYKGELLRTDVYGYYLKCICYGREEYFTKGNITLLRN